MEIFVVAENKTIKEFAVADLCQFLESKGLFRIKFTMSAKRQVLNEPQMREAVHYVIHVLLIWNIRCLAYSLSIDYVSDVFVKFHQLRSKNSVLLFPSQILLRNLKVLILCQMVVL